MSLGWPAAVRDQSKDASYNVKKTRKGVVHMTKSMRALLMGAALSGFVAGTTASAMAQNTGGDKAGKSDSGKKASKSKKDCKGKGECRTDGKPMEDHK